MQFDGDGGYDAPLNSGATAAASEPQAGPSAPSAAASGYANTNTLEGIAAASAPQAGPSAPSAASSGYGTAKNSEYRGTASATKAPKAIDKSNWDRSIKVPQSTVDAVKDAGRGNMGKVPQRTVKNDAIGLSGKGYVGSQMQYNAPVSAEYKEAVKRVYPNEVKSKPSPTFNQSSPNAKAFPKVAAPKSSKETVMKARNAEIEAANKTAKDGKFAAAVINAGKAGAEAYGAGTKERYQIKGTQTKTQKAQAAAKAERAKAVAKKK
jgi:hypothetical protein